MNEDLEEVERAKWFAENESRGRFKSRTCPTCKKENALTAFEAARGYQCRDCTRRDEGYGFEEA